MRVSISTHVLDTARGAPAAGVRVELAQSREVVASAETDGDGRVRELAADLEPGRYELVFWPPSPFFTQSSSSSSSWTATTTFRSSSRPYGCASYRGS